MGRWLRGVIDHPIAKSVRDGHVRVVPEHDLAPDTPSKPTKPRGGKPGKGECAAPHWRVSVRCYTCTFGMGYTPNRTNDMYNNMYEVFDPFLASQTWHGSKQA